MGALFGIIVIVAALIYVPYKLWREATQDQKDITKQAVPLVLLGCLSPLILLGVCNIVLEISSSASLEAMETTATVMIILLCVGFVLFLLWTLSFKIKQDDPAEIRKQMEENERFNETRAEEFREFFKKNGYDIYPEGYKILASEYRVYAKHISCQEAYTWISKKVSVDIMLYGDSKFKEELGITTKDLPDSFTEAQRNFALRHLCAEKLGLYYSDNVNTGIINANLSQILECKKFAKSYYADTLKANAPRIKL